MAIADTTVIIKAICYNPECFKKLEVNNEAILVVKRFIMNEQKSIVITKLAKVTPAGKMDEVDIASLKEQQKLL